MLVLASLFTIDSVLASLFIMDSVLASLFTMDSVALGLRVVEVRLRSTLLVFRRSFTLENAIGSHACSLEASMS